MKNANKFNLGYIINNNEIMDWKDVYEIRERQWNLITVIWNDDLEKYIGNHIID